LIAATAPPPPGHTGELTFFLILAIETAAGIYLSQRVWRRHRRGWLRLKRELPPEMLANIAIDTRVNVYVVWLLRVVQVTSEWGTAMLLLVATLNPLFIIEHPWFGILATFWIGFFYQFNAAAWNGLAGLDLWLGRRRS